MNFWSASTPSKWHLFLILHNTIVSTSMWLWQGCNGGCQHCLSVWISLQKPIGYCVPKSPSGHCMTVCYPKQSTFLASENFCFLQHPCTSQKHLKTYSAAIHSLRLVERSKSRSTQFKAGSESASSPITLLPRRSWFPWCQATKSPIHLSACQWKWKSCAENFCCSSLPTFDHRYLGRESWHSNITY